MKLVSAARCVSLVWIFSVFTLCWGMAGLGLAADPPPDKEHVLILHSYARGYVWTDNIDQGIRDRFSRRDHVILKTEYMDTKVNNSPAYYAAFKEILAAKYTGKPPRVIISSDDDALKFLKRYRDILFPGVPVVFCGVNHFRPEKILGFDQCTGVNERADFATTLALMLKLHPDTRTIHVVNDTLTTAGFLKRELLEAARQVPGMVPLNFLEDISLSDLETQLTRLPRESLVFYLSFFKDREGTTYTPEEVLPRLARAATVPIYGGVDYMLGLGIVGGMLKSSYYQGETAANLAIRILDGSTAVQIPVVLKSPNQYMFDHRQLKARDIPRAELPAASIFINEPQTFYYKYKQLIWTVTAVFLALMGFIVVLLFNIKKRIRAQRGLQTILDATASIVDYHSLENFKTELTQLLTQLLPVNKHLFIFNQETPDQTPAPVAGTGDYVPPRAGQLIQQALAAERSFISRKSGVAFFKSRYLPGNLIYMEGRRNMDDLDRDLLEIFSRNMVMSIENIEKHKIEKSLETARQIQMNMLPKDFTDFSAAQNVDLHAFLSPAKEVGGDLYDFFCVDGDHLGLVVGDVSDKGVPAALFMAMAKSLIRSAAEGNTHPEKIMEKVNNGLSRDNDQGMFVTVFLGIYNRNTRKLSFTSAGHNPPYVVTGDGEIQPVNPAPGLVIGGFEGIAYTCESLTLNPGDGLFIYSDGVTEAMDETGNFYGEERLEAALARHAAKDAQGLTQGVIDDVNQFVGNAAQSDDITMLFARC